MTQVEVTLDRWGIAHVSAPDRMSAYAAQGWVTANDRIWQMEWDRRRALGRWAEVAGPEAIREDRFFRRLGLGSAARRDWDALNDATKAMTTAYASGVNRWLSEHRDELPREFDFHPDPPEPWEPWHCVAVYKVRHVFMGTLYRKLWRGAVAVAAGPDAALAMRGDPGAATPIIDAAGPSIDLLEDAGPILAAAGSDLAGIADVDGGSNSWAIHGSRTASGLPLLAGDPHRGIEFPNVYHQCHIACPDFDAIGLAFPGVPGFPHFGHNDSVAWCITHGMADDTDVFVEPARSVRNRRTELIAVYGDEPLTVHVGSTLSGPVVLGDLGADQVLCAMWTGIWGRDSTLDCLEPMLVANGCDELEEAVTDWVVPVNNLLSADVTGNISFRIRGRVIERAIANRWTPVRGDSETRWDGTEPVDDGDLQRLRNPQRGYIATANNRTSDHGPFISVDFAGPARHDRVVELISGIDDASVEDMKAIHRDAFSSVAEKFCTLLGGVNPKTDLGVGALEQLRVWDHVLDADSAAAVVYGTTRRLWVQYVADAFGVGDVSFGEPGWPREVDSTRMLMDAATTLLLNDSWTLVRGLTNEADLFVVLGRLIDDAAAEIAERLGSDQTRWRWDAVHIMVSPHPLATMRPRSRGTSSWRRWLRRRQRHGEMRGRGPQPGRTLGLRLRCPIRVRSQ